MNLRKSRYLALLLCCAPVLSVHAGCTLPRPPSKVPDADAATEQDMVAAMQTLKRYAGDVGNYTKCLEFEVSQNRLAGDEQARMHNTAIDTLQTITAKFNEQVRLFKERH